MIRAILIAYAVGVLSAFGITLLLKRSPRHDKGFVRVDDHTIGIQTADGGRVNVATPDGVRPEKIDSARIAEGGQVEITMQDGRVDRVTGVARDPDNPYR